MLCVLYQLSLSSFRGR